MNVHIRNILGKKKKKKREREREREREKLVKVGWGRGSGGDDYEEAPEPHHWADEWTPLLVSTWRPSDG